ncbi:MAG: ATP-binding protein [Coriobacteriia bacterium]|nr:ATP-binding protein [Coriobacteriia bacterium]
MSLPIKTRLTLWYVVLFALIVGVWSGFVVVRTRADLYAGIDRELDSRASQIAISLNATGEEEFEGISVSALSGVPRAEAAAQLLTPTGTVLQSAGDVIAKSPIVSSGLVQRAARTKRAQIATVKDGGETFRVLVAPAPKSAELILVGTSTENADAAIQRLILAMLLTGPLALIGAGVGGWLLARRALRPVAEMSATAASIGIDRLDERVVVPSGGDELTALANTLNSMLSRLEAGVQDKRRLIADASHELQTPLAVMRTELDVSLAAGGLPPAAVEVLESAREETDRMTRIVRNLLTLAHFDEGTLRLLRKPTDLHELVCEAADSLGKLASESGVTVEVTGRQTMATADGEYVRQVVVNLLENAIKYSGAGAHVHLDTRAEGAEAVLVVEDNGPGIPAAAAARVFDRFYRIDSARSRELGGSGLGLAITKEIVDAHHGRIELQSDLGKGSRFTVRLPRT